MKGKGNSPVALLVSGLLALLVLAFVGAFGFFTYAGYLTSKSGAGFAYGFTYYLPGGLYWTQGTTP